MQDRLRSGELLIRDARRLAALPSDEQETVWREEQQAAAPRRLEPDVLDLAALDEDRTETREAEPAELQREPSPQQVRIPLTATPTDIAAVLRQHYSRRQLRTVARLLADD